MFFSSLVLSQIQFRVFSSVRIILIWSQFWRFKGIERLEYQSFGWKWKGFGGMKGIKRLYSSGLFICQFLYMLFTLMKFFIFMFVFRLQRFFRVFSKLFTKFFTNFRVRVVLVVVFRMQRLQKWSSVVLLGRVRFRSGVFCRLGSSFSFLFRYSGEGSFWWFCRYISIIRKRIMQRVFYRFQVTRFSFCCWFFFVTGFRVFFSVVSRVIFFFRRSCFSCSFFWCVCILRMIFFLFSGIVAFFRGNSSGWLMMAVIIIRYIRKSFSVMVGVFLGKERER